MQFPAIIVAAVDAPRADRADRAAWTRRTAVLLVAVLLASALQAISAATPADAAVDSTMESDFAALVNTERAKKGLPSLTVRSDLREVARDHSLTMAREDRLHHNPSFSQEISNWQVVAENVGRGPSVESLHDAFMNSKGHRDNILNDRVTEIGVGVEVRNGQIWVTKNFRRPTGTVTVGSTSTTRFGDVMATNVHVQGILAVATSGVADDCGLARFCPTESVTRADFVVMLAKSMGVSPANSSRFTDMTGTSAGYAEALASRGVVAGVTDTTFAPDRLLNREQLGSLFAKALDLPPQASPFTDVSGTHAGNVGAIAARGIVKGCGPDRFCPRDQVTRAQVATMLTNEFG